jgi:hypothetical protein
LGQKSKYWENKVLDALFGQTALPSIATLYVALFTTLPTTSSDVGVEPSGGSYARKSVTNNTTNWPAAITGAAAAPASKLSGSAITFATATGSWGTIIGFVIYDAASAGNLLYWGSLNTSKVINSGGIFSFPSGGIKITEA